MAYIAPIHRANSVSHALRAHLFPGGDDCLVLGKSNRLEFWRVERESGSLSLIDSKVINGKISMLQKMSPKDADTDLLFVGTERFQYFSVFWNPEKQIMETIDTFQDQDERHMREALSQDRCIVDPTGRFMVMLLWEGVLNILRLKTLKSKRLNMEWKDQIRISELYIKSATFLYAETGHPKLAFLYQTRTDRSDAHVVLYRLYADDKHNEVSRFETKDQLEHIDFEDPGAAILIPVGKGEEDQKRYIVRDKSQVKAQLGGLIIVGETRLLYYDDAARKTVEAALKEASPFVAWTEYDVSHYFLGDDYGDLWLLEIILDGATVTDLEMKKMKRFGEKDEEKAGEHAKKKVGLTSRASTLVYLGNDLLFVGSASGDSQLWRVDVEAGVSELVQEFRNISPILDFNVMDMGAQEGEEELTNEYSSGQARIVTGSGVWKDGSLRSVRSGVGLEDVGILEEVTDARTVFSIRSKGTAKHDSLIVSTLTETRVFLFDDEGGIEEVDNFKSLDLSTQTLLVRNLPSGRLLQATSAAVYLIDMEGGVVLSSWLPGAGKRITNVSANDSWLVLSVDGQNLQALRIRDELEASQNIELGSKDQVAVVHLPPQFPTICVVGFWKSGRMSIFNVEDLSVPLHGASLRRKDDNTSVPRDIALVQLLPPDKSGPTLFVTMEDGLVISFNVSAADFSLSDKKSVILGTRHVRLHLLPQSDGIYNVFATSEHPSLIYASQGRIIYSAVTAEGAESICPFDSVAFPDSILVATEDSVKISVIDNERRTHVRTLPMDQTIRRIAYSKSERVFGLGCLKRTVANNVESIISTFQMVDDVIFDQVGPGVKLTGNPAGLEMVETIIRAELKDSYGEPAERFIIGTSWEDDTPTQSSRGDTLGRILVIGLDGKREPQLITERNLKGQCRMLANMGEYIVAALSKTVVVYKYDETSTSSAELRRVASYRPSTCPIDVAVHENLIAVADQMKSMSLIEFTPPIEGEPAKLQEVCRHYQAAWATAVSHVEGPSWLEADAEGNLMLLESNEAGATAEDKKRMRMTSEINLGEMVNRIRKVTVNASPNAVVVPQAFVGTVEGGIHLFGTVSPNHQDLLIRFQTKLAQSEVVQSLGNLDFNRYRSFRNDEREGEAPERFIDGELIERFLDVDEKLQEELVEGLGPDVEQMRDMVEELKRLH